MPPRAPYNENVVVAGDTLQRSFFNRFAAAVERRQYKDLALASRVFEGQTHCTVVAPLFLEGIRYVFAGD